MMADARVAQRAESLVVTMAKLKAVLKADHWVDKMADSTAELRAER